MKKVKEDLLHFIWKYKKLQLATLVTSEGGAVIIHETGSHNHLSGPDFFNAKVEIDEQLWAGNVEIHVKSSDWYSHNHEQDANYDNVILHVVWEDNGAVFRSDNSLIPTLVLKNFVSEDVLNAYQELFDARKKSFINCERDISQIEDFVIRNWLDRMYLERLERKSDELSKLLKRSKNDWDHVLFTMLLKNFGLNINGEAFLSLAQALDFSVVRKLHFNLFELESVLFGMSHLLDDDKLSDSYYTRLRKEYRYQKNKFDLQDEGVLKSKFFKLRPSNFPTVRLAQLAGVYVKEQNLFNKIINAPRLQDLYAIFDAAASPYWENHFNFGTISKKSAKRLTNKFIDLLIVNTIIPLKFCYARHHGKAIDNEIMDLCAQIKVENNSVVSKFKKVGVKIENVQHSQAVLQLHKGYCTMNRCLDCAIGSKLLGN